MARIEGIARSRTLVARLAFFLSRRSYGRVITPARVYALDSGLLLCLVGLTPGPTWFNRLVTGLWTGIHRLAPSLVGGCRPLELRVLLQAHPFHLEYAHVVTAFGIPSEIIVAKRQPEVREA